MPISVTTGWSKVSSSLSPSLSNRTIRSPARSSPSLHMNPSTTGKYRTRTGSRLQAFPDKRTYSSRRKRWISLKRNVPFSHNKFRPIITAVKPDRLISFSTDIRQRSDSRRRRNLEAFLEPRTGFAQRLHPDLIFLPQGVQDRICISSPLLILLHVKEFSCPACA